MSATVPRQNQPASTDPPHRPPGLEGRGGHGVPSHERGHVAVLTPLGQLDRAGIGRVRQAALDVVGRPVIIDLSDCVLTDPNALASLTGEGGERVDLCFVSRRPTCRLLLARTGITARFAVFHQLEDALQARTFANAGYGQGWRRS